MTTEVKPFAAGDRVCWYHPPRIEGTVLKNTGGQCKVQWDNGEVRRDTPDRLRHADEITESNTQPLFTVTRPLGSEKPESNATPAMELPKDYDDTIRHHGLNEVMRQMVANVLRNFHRNSPHPEADPEDIAQATAAIMRIPYDPLFTKADSTCLYRVEPHDTLFDMREFLREMPREHYDDALYIRVTRALYAERSKDAS